MARLLLVFAALVLIAPAVACGGGAEEPAQAENRAEERAEEVASLEEAPPEEEETERPSYEEGLLLFTACLRNQGIEAPDIPVDADGRPVLSAGLVEQIDTDSPEFASAFAACVPLLTLSSPVDLGADPGLQAAVQDSLRRFSACMRDNGVEDFPDPAPGWDGNGSPYPVAEAFDASDPDVDAALDDCSGLISFPSVG